MCLNSCILTHFILRRMDWLEEKMNSSKNVSYILGRDNHLSHIEVVIHMLHNKVKNIVQ